MINRNDMLELIRRMTLSRNCFARVAGAYMRVSPRHAGALAHTFAEERDTERSEGDEDGYEEGTFNIHFGKLKQAEAKRNLELAKAIPFAKTNEQLKENRFPKGQARKGSMWQLLLAMKNSGLKDDGLLSIFYEIVGEAYDSADEYSIFLFYGSYDVPVKGTDGEWMEGSEEVYDFIVCAVSPMEGEYEPGKPEFGFLFPAFVDRSSDSNVIDIFNVNPDEVQTELMEMILGRDIQGDV